MEPSLNQAALTEDELVKAVVTWLEGLGFSIKQALTIKQKGVDIIAVRGGQTWCIEAKGGTSARRSSPRHGQEFNSNQILNRVAKAFYTGAKMLNDHGGPNSTIFLAFPDTQGFQNAVKPITESLTVLGIELLWVSGTGNVRKT